MIHAADYTTLSLAQLQAKLNEHKQKDVSIISSMR